MGFKNTALETIGAFAFAESNLTAIGSAHADNSVIAFPSTLKEIGEDAFYRARNITQLQFQTDIDDYDPATPAAFNASLPKLARGSLANMSMGVGIAFNINDTVKEMAEVIYGLRYEESKDNKDTKDLVTALYTAGFPVRKIEQDLTGISLSVVEEIVDDIEQGLAPVITTSDSEFAATVGTAFNRTLTADGARPITWTLVSSEAAWLSINAQTGVLSGTPTTPGTFNFTVRAMNTRGSSGDMPFTVKVSSGSTGGGSGSTGGGSTGGSGGCAAGFAPMAALFVLGALKLRKGR